MQAVFEVGMEDLLFIFRRGITPSSITEVRFGMLNEDAQRMVSEMGGRAMFRLGSNVQPIHDHKTPRRLKGGLQEWY